MEINFYYGNHGSISCTGDVTVIENRSSIKCRGLIIKENNHGSVYCTGDATINQNFGSVHCQGNITTSSHNRGTLIGTVIYYRGMILNRNELLAMYEGETIEHDDMILSRKQDTWMVEVAGVGNEIRLHGSDQLSMRCL